MAPSACGRHFREGPLGPCDGGGIVAAPKREPTHLLKEVRTLDRIAVVAEQLEARREAASGALAIARFPVEPADLPAQAGSPDAIPGRLDLLAHAFVVREGLGPPAGEPEEIGEALARDPHLGVAGPALAEGAERALVVADRVVVRIDCARPVAGGQQIAGALGLVRAVAPVVPEGFEVGQSLRVRAGGALERPPHPLVELGPAGQQEVLVDHLVHERVREPIPVSRALVPDHLDEIGLDEPIDRRLARAGLDRDVSEERLVEHRPEHGRLLEQAPGIGGQPVDAGEEQPVKRGRDVHRLARRRAYPVIALADEHALAYQAPDDLLDEERVAPGPCGDEVLELGEGVPDRGAEQPGHEGTCIARGEWGEPDDRLRRAGHDR